MFWLKSTVQCYITQVQDLWSAYEVNREQTQRKKERSQKTNTFILTLTKSKEEWEVFFLGGGGQNNTLDDFAWTKGVL